MTRRLHAEQSEQYEPERSLEPRVCEAARVLDKVGLAAAAIVQMYTMAVLTSRQQRMCLKIQFGVYVLCPALERAVATHGVQSGAVHSCLCPHGCHTCHHSSPAVTTALTAPGVSAVGRLPLRAGGAPAVRDGQRQRAAAEHYDSGLDRRRGRALRVQDPAAGRLHTR